MNRYTLKRHTSVLALVAIVLTLCLTTAIGAAASDTTTPDFAAIDRYIEAEMRDLRPNLVLIPEGSWGIMLLENAENLPDEFGPQRLQGIAAGVTSLLIGRQPPPAASSGFLLILYGAVLGIIVVQALGMLRSVALLRRWRARPADRPRGWLGIGRRVALPLVFNLSWALLILVGLPRVFGPLPVLMIGMPDLGPLLVGSGVVALGWAVVRTALAYVALRKPVAPRPVTVAAKAS